MMTAREPVPMVKQRNLTARYLHEIMREWPDPCSWMGTPSYKMFAREDADLEPGSDLSAEPAMLRDDRWPNGAVSGWEITCDGVSFGVAYVDGHLLVDDPGMDPAAEAVASALGAGPPRALVLMEALRDAAAAGEIADNACLASLIRNARCPTAYLARESQIPALLRLIASDPRVAIREAVADNWFTPLQALERMGKGILPLED